MFVPNCHESCQKNFLDDYCLYQRLKNALCYNQIKCVIKMEFAEKLKRIRCKMNLTQKDVAEIVGITRTAYANYEQGLREPDLATVRKLCVVLNVSADDLLDIKNETD